MFVKHSWKHLNGIVDDLQEWSSDFMYPLESSTSFEVTLSDPGKPYHMFL